MSPARVPIPNAEGAARYGRSSENRGVALDAESLPDHASRPGAMILRKRVKDHFVQIPNETARDARLSFKAVGVLTHILSLPDASPISADRLAKAHTDGRASVLSALQELTEAGYYRVDRIRNEDGTFRMEVSVSNLPDLDRPEFGFPTPEDPASGEPASGDPTPTTEDRGEDQTEENTLSLSLDDAPSPEPDPFDAFWSLYPRKTGKANARQSWTRALVKKRVDPAAIMAGLDRNLSELRSREPQFVPHAATWLNGERWNDEPPAARRAKGAPVSYENTEQAGSFEVDAFAHRRSAG